MAGMPTLPRTPSVPRSPQRWQWANSGSPGGWLGSGTEAHLACSLSGTLAARSRHLGAVSGVLSASLLGPDHVDRRQGALIGVYAHAGEVLACMRVARASCTNSWGSRA
jgi:hypothetical protein